MLQVGGKFEDALFKVHVGKTGTMFSDILVDDMRGAFSYVYFVGVIKPSTKENVANCTDRTDCIGEFIDDVDFV